MPNGSPAAPWLILFLQIEFDTLRLRRVGWDFALRLGLRLVDWIWRLPRAGYRCPAQWCRCRCCHRRVAYGWQIGRARCRHRRVPGGRQTRHTRCSHRRAAGGRYSRRARHLSHSCEREHDHRTSHQYRSHRRLRCFGPVANRITLRLLIDQFRDFILKMRLCHRFRVDVNQSLPITCSRRAWQVSLSCPRARFGTGAAVICALIAG